MRDYSKDFAEWRKWRDEKGLPPIYDNPADAGIETDFRVGQQVSFTNEYGVRFEPHIIMGFCKPELSGRCVYLDYDCYWFPTELKSLKPYRKGKTFIIPADAPGNSLRSKSGARGLITTKKPDRIAVNSWRYRTTVSISTFTTYV